MACRWLFAVKNALGVRKTYRGQSTKWVWDGNVPLHEWVEGTLEPLDEPDTQPQWSADPLIAKREAELQAQLNQGPPERGTKKAPITWLFEPESFAPMAKLVAGRQHSILTDHLGTPVLMVDAEGAASWRANISVYGELRGLEGERHACPFRWPGQYEDLETGLYYNRFRYYDPEAGQYASQDPIGLAGGLGFHAYVHDPLTWVDPLGLAPTGPTGVSALTDAALQQETHDLMHRDKRAPGNRSQGTHGLSHRYNEQVTGKMRPGSKGWDTHEQQILNQQKALRERLREMEKRQMTPPKNAWKLATIEPPSGNQRRLPGCAK